MSFSIMHHAGHDAAIEGVRNTPDNANALHFTVTGSEGHMDLTIFNLPPEVTAVLLKALQKVEKPDPYAT